MNQLATMLKQLEGLAIEADEQRLMVFADEFEAAFPDYAEDIRQTMTLPPSEAVTYLSNKYLAMVVLRFIPDAESWIATLQRAYAARETRDAKAKAYMSAHPPRL